MILNSAWLNAVGMGGFSALAATKSAVRSFARSWSCELMDRKIRVNAVSPGAIDTPIFELEGNTPEQMEETKRQMALRIPAGRMGRPEEIAQAVLFLASDESSYTSGASLLMDGGWIA